MLAAFDALGQGYFFFGRQQGNAADLLEIEADGVVRLDGGDRAIVQLVGDFVFFRAFLFRRLADLDAVLGQRGKNLIQLIDIGFCFGEQFQNFVIRDVAALPADGQQLLFGCAEDGVFHDQGFFGDRVLLFFSFGCLSVLSLNSRFCYFLLVSSCQIAHPLIQLTPVGGVKLQK